MLVLEKQVHPTEKPLLQPISFTLSSQSMLVLEKQVHPTEKPLLQPISFTLSSQSTLVLEKQYILHVSASLKAPTSTNLICAKMATGANDLAGDYTCLPMTNHLHTLERAL